MSSPVPKRLSPYRGLFVWIIGTLSLAGMALVLVWHWDYYALTRMQRPFHDLHDLLRSSGTVGLTLGIGATILFVLNLGYLVRKKLINVTALGPLRDWMDAHVLTGLTGTGLIALHSGMVCSSALGTLAVIAMSITVVTGIVGRTIYIQVPRSLEGRELEFKQVQDELEACRDQLQQAGVQADWLHQPGPQARAHPTGFVGCLMAMAMGDHERRQDYRRLKRQVLGSPTLKSSARQILPLAKEFCIHWQWLMRYRELRSLIASWRFFHRWLAVLMLCVVICHIVVAVRFGDLAIWGGIQ